MLLSFTNTWSEEFQGFMKCVVISWQIIQQILLYFIICNIKPNTSASIIAGRKCEITNLVWNNNDFITCFHFPSHRTKGIQSKWKPVGSTFSDWLKISNDTESTKLFIFHQSELGVSFKPILKILYSSLEFYYSPFFPLYDIMKINTCTSLW